VRLPSRSFMGHVAPPIVAVYFTRGASQRMSCSLSSPAQACSRSRRRHPGQTAPGPEKGDSREHGISRRRYGKEPPQPAASSAWRSGFFVFTSLCRIADTQRVAVRDGDRRPSVIRRVRAGRRAGFLYPHLFPHAATHCQRRRDPAAPCQLNPCFLARRYVPTVAHEAADAAAALCRDAFVASQTRRSNSHRGYLS
jgi:hypothetical protein